MCLFVWKHEEEQEEESGALNERERKQKQRKNRSEVDEGEGNRVVETMGSVLKAPSQRRGSRESGRTRRS